MSFAREASGSSSPCSRQSSDWGCVHGVVLRYALVTRSASTPSDCWSSRLPREVRPRPGGCGKGESEARMWRRRVYRILGEPRQPLWPPGCPELHSASCPADGNDVPGTLPHPASRRRQRRCPNHDGCARFPRMDCVPVVPMIHFQYYFFFLFFSFFPFFLFRLFSPHSL